jgi:hypothetical protein
LEPGNELLGFGGRERAVDIGFGQQRGGVGVEPIAPGTEAVAG